MAVRHTIERILRDDDDDSGQSIREWRIETEGTHVTVRRREGDGFILLRAADIDTLITDLRRAQEASQWALTQQATP